MSHPATAHTGFTRRGTPLILLLLLCLGGAGFPSHRATAQATEQPRIPAHSAYTFDRFGRETVDFVTRPAEWDGRDWLTLGLIGAGAWAIEATIDHPMRDYALDHQRWAKSVPIEAGRMWGELYTPAAVFSGFAIHSLVTGDEGSRKIAYEIGQASIYAGALTTLLKIAAGRARPFTGEGPRSFHPFSTLFDDAYHSFPSGHNTVAFVLSTVLSRNARPLWLKILAYVPAALTFASRIVQDKHWTSDDFTGAAIAYSVAAWVVDLHERTASDSTGMTFITPFSININF